MTMLMLSALVNIMLDLIADLASVHGRHRKALDLEVLVKGVDGTIAPHDVVRHDRLHVLGALRQTTGYRVQDESGMEVCNESYVNVEAGRVLDFAHGQSIHRVTFFLADKIYL